MLKYTGASSGSQPGTTTAGGLPQPGSIPRPMGSTSALPVPPPIPSGSGPVAPPPPPKIPKRRGRPPLNRPKPGANAGDGASNASASPSPSKPPYTGKKRGRPLGSTTKKPTSQPPPPTQPPANNGLSANSASVIISSLAYTPADPSNHPLRKQAQLEPAPLLRFNTDPPNTIQYEGAGPRIPTHISVPHDMPSRSNTRVFGLEEAPVFRPSVEEFADPIKYIAWIASPNGGNAKEYGIAKIIPPEGWTPDFVLDQEKFRFRTRLQRLNSLSAEARATLNYHEQLQKFHSQQGHKRVSIPIIDRKPVDLYMLRRMVDAHGGFDAVVKARRWSEVTRNLGYPEKDAPQLSAQVKAAYVKIILPFELFLAKAKEQGRTVNFSTTAAPGSNGSMTMAGSAHLLTDSGQVSGVAQLQMTINGTSPSRLSAVVKEITSKDTAAAAAAPAAASTTAASTPLPSAKSTPPPSQKSTGSPAQRQASESGTAASTEPSTGDKEPSVPASVSTPTKSTDEAPAAAASEAGPSSAGATDKSAVVAAAGGDGAAEESGLPESKSWSEELLAAGLSHEEIAQIEAEAAGKRRSSRKRNDTTTTPAPSTPVAGRKRKHADDNAPRVVEILTTQGAEEQMCEICLRGDNGTSMLLCDDCNRGYHMFCLDPPLTTIPKSQWFCPPCLVGTGNDFGFDDGETHSLHSFWQRAELFRNSWWSIKKRQEQESSMRAAAFGEAMAKPGNQASTSTDATKAVVQSNGTASSPAAETASEEDVTMADAPAGAAATGASTAAFPVAVSSSSAAPAPAKAKTSPTTSSPPAVKSPPDEKEFRGVGRRIPGTSYYISEDEVEREYWRLVHSSQEAVEVEYGADIHSTTHGSALPTLETHPENPYSKDAWNLNNLPITSGSLLRYIKSDISGMTVPWIYVGMMFSTFCWHNEDHFTYSVNYQHWGDTKTWYGVPGADAQKFEEAMRRVAPDLFETSPDLLFQLVTMMSPERLREQGVRVYAADQRPNEFVVTFPKAYHSGFNQGFNLNEAVNFALPDWIDTGLECVKRYQQFRKFPVFSHDELLCTILHHHLTVNSASWLRAPISDMVDRELERRRALRDQIRLMPTSVEEWDRPEEEYQCGHCNMFSYLSQVTSPTSTRAACLEHAAEVCGADKSKWTLRMRYDDEYLRSMQTKVADRAGQPATWKVRFRKVLLGSTRPGLKTLRALLADGERIKGLPEVEQLRAFVEKANDWVERANAVISRRSHRVPHDVVQRRALGGEFALYDFLPQSSNNGSAPTPVPASKQEQDRSPETVRALLEEVENLGFDAPEITTLNSIVSDISEFARRADRILEGAKEEQPAELEECYAVYDLGESINVDIPQRAELKSYLARRLWTAYAKMTAAGASTRNTSLDAEQLLTAAKQLGIPEDEPLLAGFKEQVDLAKSWAQRVKAVLDNRAPQSKITFEQMDELLRPQPHMDSFLHRDLDERFKMMKSLADKAAWLLRSQESENRKAFWNRKPEDPTTAIRGAKELLKQIDNMNLLIPPAETIRTNIVRHDSWVKRFEDVVVSAFSPGMTPKKPHLEAMMDALCMEISHTADPRDHYPTNPALRLCVCRTTEMPPPRHPETRLCSSCATMYHLPCIKIEEPWIYKDWEEATKNWRCPVCDPTKLPALLQHRQTLGLDAIAPLVEEETWQPQSFLFLPVRYFALSAALDQLRGLTQVVADFLKTGPSLDVPREAAMLRHSMRKVLACPVNVTLPDGASAMDVIRRIILRWSNVDEKGKRLPALPPPPSLDSTHGERPAKFPSLAPPSQRASPRRSPVPVAGSNSSTAVDAAGRAKQVKETHHAISANTSASTSEIPPEAAPSHGAEAAPPQDEQGVQNTSDVGAVDDEGPSRTAMVTSPSAKDLNLGGATTTRYDPITDTHRSNDAGAYRDQEEEEWHHADMVPAERSARPGEASRTAEQADEAMAESSRENAADRQSGAADGPTSPQPGWPRRKRKAQLIFEEEIGPHRRGDNATAQCLCKLHREAEMITCERCSNWFHLDCVMMTPYQARSDQKWTCPFCCLKLERKYQYAEIKVKDEGCPPGYYVDLRATMRSPKDVIRKPQHWMLSNHRRIVLNLLRFIPAAHLRGDGTLPDQESDDGDAPVRERPSWGRKEDSQSGPSAGRSEDRTDRDPLDDDFRSHHVESSRARLLSPDPEPNYGVTAHRRARNHSGRGRVVPGRGRPEDPTHERHRQGMQNLYARGVTDAMISKWCIGWNGHRLVYPHEDPTGRIIELDLGSSINLAPDDPDGTKFILARIARKEEDDRMYGMRPGWGGGPSPARRAPEYGLMAPSYRDVGSSAFSPRDQPYREMHDGRHPGPSRLSGPAQGVPLPLLRPGSEYPRSYDRAYLRPYERQTDPWAGRAYGYDPYREPVDPRDSHAMVPPHRGPEAASYFYESRHEPRNEPRPSRDLDYHGRPFHASRAWQTGRRSPPERIWAPRGSQSAFNPPAARAPAPGPAPVPPPSLKRTTPPGSISRDVRLSSGPSPQLSISRVPLTDAEPFRSGSVGRVSNPDASSSSGRPRQSPSTFPQSLASTPPITTDGLPATMTAAERELELQRIKDLARSLRPDMTEAELDEKCRSLYQ
ncbi:hypothetical protein OC846_003449 [Tilletia horrida]|uniref:[histone H3]-trimethyl-L-lysine(4) demethylase n=1 Tax=Tilletia horrida TaxID=155126 RepID=A0AAN6GQE5_9BASI|nr:hypothetical protein OC846_003449 [Tilletia horrida]KAK0566031.1 hypothetical protein OC861_003466 [Tilletia horrida]